MAQTTEELMLGGYVPHDAFATFINAYKIPLGVTTLMLLEIQPRNVVKSDVHQSLLLFEQFNPEADFASYTSGRIFHEQGELRWERHLADMQVVYTGDRAYKPELNDSEERTLDACASLIRSYFLFGKRLDEGQLKRIGPAAQLGDFAEVRIPRLLRYPQLEELKDAERIQLAVCEYVDCMTGMNIAYRFKKLVPAKMSQEQEKL